MRTVLPWQLVRVSGASMVPTLKHGDRVLVRWGARIEPGQVVLGRFRSRPELLVIKRADHRQGTGWFLRSDNEFAGGDSSSHGVADILARAQWRWRADAVGLSRLRPQKLTPGR
jgi:SOS-response transcriptional repressor LexA